MAEPNLTWLMAAVAELDEAEKARDAASAALDRILRETVERGVSVSAAARALGISRVTAYKRLDRAGS